MRRGEIASRILAVVDACGQRRLEYTPSAPYRQELAIGDGASGYIGKLVTGDYAYKGRKTGNRPVSMEEMKAEGFMAGERNNTTYLDLTEVMHAFYKRRDINIRLAKQAKAGHLEAMGIEPPSAVISR